MILRRSQEFDALYENLPVTVQKRTDKQLLLLLQNPQHPSLRIHKMEGHPDIWEMRVTTHIRITFIRKGDTIILRKIGSHHILKNP